MNKVNIIIFTLIVAFVCSCSSSNSDFQGRIRGKAKLASSCEIKFSWQLKSGVIACSDKSYELKLRSGDKFFSETHTCNVSETTYNNVEAGEIFICNYE